MSDQPNKGYCIFSQEIAMDSKTNLYRLPGVDIDIDKLSYNLFTSSDIRAFVAVLKGPGKVYALQPLKEEEYEKYRRRTLTTEDTEVKYREAKEIGSGAYGKVDYYPTENIIVKRSVEDHKWGLPGDMVKEVAVYNLLGKILCLPDYNLIYCTLQALFKIFLYKGQLPSDKTM